MKRPLRNSGRLLCVVLMFLLLLTGSSLLPGTAANTAQNALNQPASDGVITISLEEYNRLKQYEEMDELLQIVEAFYYQEPDVNAMIENAERGLLYGLEDPYTFYYSATQFEEMWADDEGEYAGIGIQLMGSYETFLCVITRVFDGSPARDAGLRKGDILIKVEELDVTAYSLNEAVSIMRGEPGKTVEIQVLRGDETLAFTIPRAVIHVNRVSSCMLDASTGYIALYDFAGDCSITFREQLDELIEQGAKSLVLDLRDNAGGWVEDAVTIADFFLPEGTVTYMEDRYGKREYYKSTPGEVSIPLVVLINENSASSSELLAGALQDHKRATIVGTQSFGKGVVQIVLPVGTEGAGMQVTTAQYFTPDGNHVHKVGITPDVEAALPEGDTTWYELGDLNDVPLKKAYEVALELAGK